MACARFKMLSEKRKIHSINHILVVFDVKVREWDMLNSRTLHCISPICASSIPGENVGKNLLNDDEKTAWL